MARGSKKNVGEKHWRLVWDLEPDPLTGRRKQRKEYFHGTEKQADVYLAEKIVEVARGKTFGDPKMTLAEFAEAWLPHYAGRVRPATLAKRKQDLRLYVLPVLGRKRMGDLRPAQLQRLVSDLGDRLAPNTVGSVVATLNALFGQAVRWKVVPDNPAEGVVGPSAKRGEKRKWTPAEAALFLGKTTEDRHHLAYVLAIFAHLRIGEVIGLKWDDVDWERELIRVERSVSKGEGGEVVGPPKSESGRRAILLPPAVMQAIKRHRLLQHERRLKLGSKWVNEGWVFDRGDGRRLSAGVLRHGFERAVARVDVPYLSFHGLRHTGATAMLAAGVHPKIASARLGHASVGITLDLYSHAQVSMQQTASESLAKLIELGAEETG